ADRLLRQVQGFGGTGHVLALGDGDEDAQLLKGHAVLTSKCRSPPVLTTNCGFPAMTPTSGGRLHLSRYLHHLVSRCQIAPLTALVWLGLDRTGRVCAPPS